MDFVVKDLPTFSYFATVGRILPKMGDFEEEQREEVDALVSIFSEEMTVESLIIQILIFSDILIISEEMMVIIFDIVLQ